MINELLTAYPSITLEQIHGVKLLNRIDTKYVTTVEKVTEFLRMARNRYFVQDFNGSIRGGEEQEQQAQGLQLYLHAHQHKYLHDDIPLGQCEGEDRRPGLPEGLMR